MEASLDQTHALGDEKVADTAAVVLTATDQGQHGFASCEKCGATLQNWVTDKNCPHCGVVLKGTKSHPGFGGSD
jgi:rubrerythrin